ncbi:MAG TPA: hypothetical protein VGL81_10090 [Polyangiaceae bacterium]|jgi:hypothetical protein
MSDRREPSHPPSEPHSALARASGILNAEDRPVRVQLVGALLLGLVLVASGLYLWRRPHSSDTTTSDPASASAAGTALAALGGDAGLEAIVGGGIDAGNSGPVSLSDARILACQDHGSKKTAPDACDHLAPIEQALSSAIHQASSCVPGAAGGGTIEYVADVSFSRHKVNVSLPRAGRSVHDRKALRACSAAVRGALQGVPLDGVDHQHARYKIAVTATYRGTTNGG